MPEFCRRYWLLVCVSKLLKAETNDDDRGQWRGGPVGGTYAEFTSVFDVRVFLAELKFRTLNRNFLYASVLFVLLADMIGQIKLHSM